ncbi:hypothetical protein LOTGIDRAFT_159207 [Lottia gigantea]|uniref:RING-type domain-containing protein n=1 Tax=Lottia gigantea TaxID=225164 RepID=V4C9I0_LOTGI|nr:hypothetical protein LOTGIDRAFT_159207 [Lottia gigantea]ESO98399.1 hypothetical protein LOTGIDRAFT_159207 [Lottia gigantea]
MVSSVLEGSVGSSGSDENPHWQSVLTCYLCGELFRRPRILPCGHTFCSECLARLREEVIREGKLNGTYSNKMKEIGHFVCPMPECRYSMRLMNLTRFSAKNKTVSEAIGALKRQQHDRQRLQPIRDLDRKPVNITVAVFANVQSNQIAAFTNFRDTRKVTIAVEDASTQTDITLESVIIAIPQSLIQNTRKKMDGNSTFVNTVFQRAISMDNISSHYIPPRDFTWRSCVAMLGVNIIQQIMQM